MICYRNIEKENDFEAGQLAEHFMGKVALRWLLMKEYNFDVWKLGARPYQGEGIV